MGFFKRIRNLYRLSNYEPEIVTKAPWFKKEKAEFIMPNRVTEILEVKPGASLDDVLES